MRRARIVQALVIAVLLTLLALPVQAFAENGFVVCLDPGHGTYYYNSNGERVTDNGAGANGVSEATTNWLIAQACKEELEANGYTVVLTHTTNFYYQGEKGSYYNAYTGTTIADEKPGYNWANWKNAVAVAVGAEADLFVEMHCNAAENTSANGTEIYYQYSSTATGRTSTYHYETCSLVSYRVATNMLQCLSDEITFNNRGAKVTTRDSVRYPDGSYTDGYSWLLLAREENLPAILIEHAFVTNTRDAYILKNYPTEIGIADAHGIMAALEADGVWTENETGRAFQKPDGELARDEWVQILGFWYYFDGNGNPITDSITIDDVIYYFNDKGKVIAASSPTAPPEVTTGWQKEDGKWYFYSSNGVRVTNTWKQYNGGWYYFGADGALVIGNWISYNGGLYYAGSDGHAVSDWQKIDGVWHYFDLSSCKMLTNGWATSGSSRYYFDGDGRLVSGWLTAQGKRFYLDPSTYAAATGWKKIDNEWHYFNSDGSMVTDGLARSGEKTYFMDENGLVKGGWQKIDGSWHHFDETTYVMDTGWKKIDNTWRFFNSDGSLLVDGIAHAGEKLYYMNADGTLEAGWKKIDGLWYHFNEETFAADMSTWVQEDGTWYYLGTSGTLVMNGWASSDGNWYYMGSDGKSVSGWLQLNGKWYYFDPTTHAAVESGTYIIDGKSYTFENYVLQTSSGGSSSGSDESYKDQYTEVYTPKSSGYLWHLSGNGYYYYEVNSSGASTGAWQWVEPIMGTTKTTVNAMVAAFTRRGVSYPSSVYASKGASTIREFCQIVYDEAVAEGVRAEVLFAQIMWETGWLQFGGDVSPSQCNFGGIGATGGGAPGNTFANVREGIRAQVQHLKAYGSTAPLVNACVDPRFGYVTRGIIPYVQGLGIPDDPAGYGWAGGRLYGAQLVNLMRVYLGV